MKELHGLKFPLEWPVVFYGGTSAKCRDRFHDEYERERTDRISHQTCANTILFPGTLIDIARMKCDCRTCEPTGESHYFAILTINPETGNGLQNYPQDRNGNIICPNCILDRHPTINEGIPREPYEAPPLRFMEFDGPHEHYWHETEDLDQYCCRCEGIEAEDHPDEQEINNNEGDHNYV